MNNYPAINQDPLELLINKPYEEDVGCFLADNELEQPQNFIDFPEDSTFGSFSTQDEQFPLVSDIDSRLQEVCEKYNPAKNKSGKRAWEITRLLRIFVTSKGTGSGRSTASSSKVKTKKKANLQNTILRDVFRRIKMSRKVQGLPKLTRRAPRLGNKKEVAELVSEFRDEFIAYFEEKLTSNVQEQFQYYDLTCRECDNFCIEDCVCARAFELIMLRMQDELLTPMSESGRLGN